MKKCIFFCLILLLNKSVFAQMPGTPGQSATFGDIWVDCLFAVFDYMSDMYTSGNNHKSVYFDVRDKGLNNANDLRDLFKTRLSRFAPKYKFEEKRHSIEERLMNENVSYIPFAEKRYHFLGLLSNPSKLLLYQQKFNNNYRQDIFLKELAHSISMKTEE